ncbi:MAG: DUF4129 domain-containing protein [Anaerolineales bacterium]|nr:DUF4129 domain-containing protein [Anaerolineales bacterium]
MRSLFNGKIWIILLAFLALTGLIILASGLNGMKFDEPNMVKLDNFFRLSNSSIPEDRNQVSWFRYFVIGMFFVLFLAMLGPIRPQTGKSWLSQLLRFLAFTVIAMMVMGRFAQNNPMFSEEGQSQTPGAETTTQQQTFIAPEVNPQSEFWITALVAVVIGVTAVVLFNRFVDRWFKPKNNLEEIAEIARSALTDLSKNKESRNVIIRSYTRMNAAVNEYRGIAREEAMTPSEFASYLEKEGLPGQAINGLTRVFEKVRYGAQNVSPEEIKEAKQCLTSILKACETNR